MAPKVRNYPITGCLAARGTYLVRRPILCRGLCRNPAIPTAVGLLHPLSLSHTRKAVNMLETRMNTACLYHLEFFGVSPLDFAL